MEEYKIALEAIIDPASLTNLQTQLKNADIKPIPIVLDTTKVDAQIKSIRSQIEALKNIKIDFGAGKTRNGSVNISQTTAAYKELSSIMRQIESLTKRTTDMKIAGVDPRNIATAQAQLKSLTSEYDRLYYKLQNGNLSKSDFKALNGDISNVKGQLAQLGVDLDKVQSKVVTGIKTGLGEGGSLSLKVQAVEKDFIALGVQADDVSAHIAKLKSLMMSMDANDDIESVNADYKEFQATLAIVKERISQIKTAQNMSNSTMNLKDSRLSFASEIDSWLTKNSAAVKQFGARIQEIKAQIATADQQKLTHLKAEWLQTKRAAEAAGVATQNFTDRFKAQMQKLTTYFSASFVILRIIQVLRTGMNTITELDTALIDLKKTTDATETELKSFYYTANDIAKQLGVTTQAVIQAAAEWSRLGYSIKDAETMAQTSAIFSAISPNVDIEKATDGLVSAMKAFNIEADDALDGIASKINAIGNSQAVSNEDIIDFLTRSSSAMKEANNTLDETIALGTAATEITRNADQVGNALKTVSMRIRGYDEETEEYVGGVEVLSGKIANLTKTADNFGGVSLFKDGDKNTFKSTTELLRDISEIYDDLTDKQQAELLEALASKRQGQIVAAILNNFDAVESSLETMENSAGNAEKEMSIIMESLEYKINRLKETGTGFFQNIFQTDEVGVLVDILAGLLSVLDGLTDTFGLLGTVMLAVPIVKFIKNFSCSNKENNVIQDTLIGLLWGRFIIMARKSIP